MLDDSSRIARVPEIDEKNPLDHPHRTMIWIIVVLIENHILVSVPGIVVATVRNEDPENYV